MPTTNAELVLSPAYRQAQRILASWLEQNNRAARRSAFAARAALAGLDAVERSRLARWLAWLCVAAGRRGESALVARIQRLDAGLYGAVGGAMLRLPLAADRQPAGRAQRLIA
jgi:hypothetical protein